MKHRLLNKQSLVQSNLWAAARPFQEGELHVQGAFNLSTFAQCRIHHHWIFVVLFPNLESRLVFCESSYKLHIMFLMLHIVSLFQGQFDFAVYS